MAPKRPDPNDPRRATITAESHRAIGHFISEFQGLDACFGSVIKFLLIKEGLKNERLADILLADLTMYPLKSIFQAMAAEMAPKDATPFENQVLAEIFRRTDALIEVRNKIAHGDIHVGGGHFEDQAFEHLLLMKNSRGRHGLNSKRLNLKPEQLDEWAHECRLVSRLASTALTALLVPHRKRISDLFERDAVGVLGLSGDAERPEERRSEIYRLTKKAGTKRVKL